MSINPKIEITPPVIKGKPRAVYAVDGLSAYELAVKHGYEGTEEEWLNTIVRGEPGYTPKLGVDYFNGADGADGYTPVKGVDYFDGKDGNTPYIKDGNWWIGETNTGVKAEGKDGTDGENGGTFYNDEIPFNKDDPTLGTNYPIRPENYPFVEFSKYKKGSIYSRQWNDEKGSIRKGTALFKYEGTLNNFYTFTLIALIYDGNGAPGVTPKLRVNSTTNYWEVSYDNGVTWESTDTKATGKDGEGGGTNFTTDETLTLSETNVLSVNTVNEAKENESKPITSGAVYSELSTLCILLDNL